MNELINMVENRIISLKKEINSGMWGERQEIFIKGKIEAYTEEINDLVKLFAIPEVIKFVTCYTCHTTKGKLPEGDNYCNMCDHYF